MQCIQELDTSGARAVESFVIDGRRYLAVPQLALDVEGRPPQMTAGNSDCETIVWRWEPADGGFAEFQRLLVPGGEDAEFFRIGERAFLATASLRSGSGPYSLDLESTIFEWRGGRFEPFQRIEGFAAKQWTHFTIGERHFLALALGVSGDAPPARWRRESCIFEWRGGRFEHFQDVASAWGYNFAFAEVGGHLLLAHADHALPSRLLRWNGTRFEDFQLLEGHSGRAFQFFESEGAQWLAFARLHEDSVLYRWSGERFDLHQSLGGPGGREFAWLPGPEGDRLLLVNFIQGTREAPVTALRSVFLR